MEFDPTAAPVGPPIDEEERERREEEAEAKERAAEGETRESEEEEGAGSSSPAARKARLLLFSPAFLLLWALQVALLLPVVALYPPLGPRPRGHILEEHQGRRRSLHVHAHAHAHAHAHGHGHGHG